MAEAPVGVTFQVCPTRPGNPNYEATTLQKQLQPIVRKFHQDAKILKTTESPNTIAPALGNGFVGAAFSAYNSHHRLVLSPDDIWIAITTTFAQFVDRNAETMRNLFVDHAGQIGLSAYGGGGILTADYDDLVGQLAQKIEEKTKAGIRDWLECSFSTTTPKIRLISKVVLMGAMKNYFTYAMYLECGLPAVTLLGTLDDWKNIRSRVDRLGTYNMPELNLWSEVLGNTLDQFVNAYQGKRDTDWWNRIATKTGGGSGPRYLEGWILSFIPWTEEGRMVLNPLSKIKSTKSYGKMDTNEIPVSAVDVPVTIDDNGHVYHTKFLAGAYLSSYDKQANTMSPALDWAMVDVSCAFKK